MCESTIAISADEREDGLVYRRHALLVHRVRCVGDLDAPEAIEISPPGFLPLQLARYRLTSSRGLSPTKVSPPRKTPGMAIL